MKPSTLLTVTQVPSFFPILILYQMGTINTLKKSKQMKKLSGEIPHPEVLSDEWEIASDDDLQSGEFEVG